MSSLVDKTISHYKILVKLGEGGMGVVYKAEGAPLKRTVALKFPPRQCADPDAKERFIHKSQTASALQHHNICVVHDIDDVHDGQLQNGCTFDHTFGQCTRKHNTS